MKDRGTTVFSLMKIDIAFVKEFTTERILDINEITFIHTCTSEYTIDKYYPVSCVCIRKRTRLRIENVSYDYMQTMVHIYIYTVCIALRIHSCECYLFTNRESIYNSRVYRSTLWCSFPFSFCLYAHSANLTPMDYEI